MHILVGGPVHASKGFLACGDQKKSWVFLGCIHVFDLVLKYGSDINEGNCLQLLFYFFVLIGVVASVIGMSFSQLCFRFYIEVFSYCVLMETFAIGFQNWFDHESIDFWVFRSELASFVNFKSLSTEICKSCSIFVLFWWHQLLRSKQQINIPPSLV